MGTKYSNIQEVVDGISSRFLPGNAPEIDAVFQFDFTGEGGGNWYMTVKDQSLTVSEGVCENPTITLTVAADDWLKIMNGESNPALLMMKGRLKISGDMGLAMKFQQMFS
jgi:putative sterol carrier protein